MEVRKHRRALRSCGNAGTERLPTCEGHKHCSTKVDQSSSVLVGKMMHSVVL